MEQYRFLNIRVVVKFVSLDDGISSALEGCLADPDVASYQNRLVVRRSRREDRPMREKQKPTPLDETLIGWESEN